MRTFAELMDGLPPLPPEPERKEAPIDDGETITRHRLRFWLSRLDPPMPQPDWIKIIMGVHATPLENDPHANDRRQIARDWSEGLLDHRGRYEKAPTSNYEGTDAVDTAFDSVPPRADGITWKHLRHEVRALNGHAQETFGDILEDIEDGVASNSTAETNNEREPTRQLKRMILGTRFSSRMNSRTCRRPVRSLRASFLKIKRILALALSTAARRPSPCS